MDLSTLTPQNVAALQNMSPEAFLNLLGVRGRPLNAGGQTKLEERHRRHLKKTEERTLREVATGSHMDAVRVQTITRALEDGDLSIKRLSEAVSETQLVQLLRYGVTNFMFDAYAQVNVVYPDLVRAVQSGGAEELYAPLYGPELPQKVGAGQEFGDSRLAGIDVHVKNDKYGRILAIEEELIDDDKTGQIPVRAAQMGERMRYVEEQVAIAAIENAVQSDNTANSGYNTTLGNITPNTSYGQVSQPLIESAHTALMQMKDPFGNLIMVEPNTILFSSADYFNIAKLLQSALQPSVPGGSGQTANTATSGMTGWTMTTNPLQGLYAPKMSRFLSTNGGLDGTHGHAYLLEAQKGIVFQERTALRVLQEAANSGAGFERGVIRYRVDRRFAAATIESRYGFRLN